MWERSAALNFALSLSFTVVARRPQHVRRCPFLLFNFSFLRHYRCTGRRILVRLRSFIVLFFFSALGLAGLLILTVGVSPTRLLVSWCDVCPQSALLGQGRTHGQQGPVRIGGMLFLRDSLDLSFHQARARTSTHLHCFSQRFLDPRVLFFIGGLWRSFTLEGAGRSKLPHMFSSSVRRFRQRITEQVEHGSDEKTADGGSGNPRQTVRASLLSVCLATGHPLDWPTWEPPTISSAMS